MRPAIQGYQIFIVYEEVCIFVCNLIIKKSNIVTSIFCEHWNCDWIQSFDAQSYMLR